MVLIYLIMCTVSVKYMIFMCDLIILIDSWSNYMSSKLFLLFSTRENFTFK